MQFVKWLVLMLMRCHRNRHALIYYYYYYFNYLVSVLKRRQGHSGER